MIHAQKVYLLKLSETRFNCKNYHSDEVECRFFFENQMPLVLFVETIKVIINVSFLLSLYCYLVVLLSLEKAVFLGSYSTFTICNMGYIRIGYSACKIITICSG